ncbi:hypothetical protein ARMGADRAFT_1091577 [Armillaria gallica]|uniref:Uncharacterized protein n=1 Tax=Armillaria gallica TaxID=47427 RepID=A0A2H3D0V2_ARMGA|nr:hypothetical protein ARMGADRAFT_1091577 [Armillaria gallica]
MATHGEAPTFPQPQPPWKLPTPPRQSTPMDLSWTLYLLSTGKLTTIPEALFHVPLLDLFNHFMTELVEDPDWAVTPAGMDYTHYGYSYILKEEARHFACITFNMIHQEQTVEVPARYRRPSPDISSVATTPEPMADSPSVPPQRAQMPTTYAYTVPSYFYPQGYGPPGTQGLARLFAAASVDDSGTLNQPPTKPQPPSGPPGPATPPVNPMRWALPRYLPPPEPPDPPAPWVLNPNNLGPWAALKPNMVKEPDSFSGNSNDIARFFSQCDMYFSVYNQYFRYHPHKVIFCMSHFTKDAQTW